MELVLGMAALDAYLLSSFAYFLMMGLVLAWLITLKKGTRR